MIKNTSFAEIDLATLGTVTGGDTQEQVHHTAYENGLALTKDLAAAGVPPKAAGTIGAAGYFADRDARIDAINSGQLYKALMRKTPSRPNQL